MNDTVKVFDNPKFGKVRTVLVDGKVWFVASDVARALGYANANDAIIKHCRCVAKRDIPHPQSKNATVEVNTIPEGDVYRLIVHSKLPTAEKFERWVFDEVLPAIRATGSFSLQKPDSYMIENPVERAKRWIEEEQERQRLRKENKEMLPKAEFYNTVADSDSLLSMGDVAKMLDMGIGRNRLFKFLDVVYTVTYTKQRGVDYIRKLLLKAGDN